jgi:stress-induced morphogen
MALYLPSYQVEIVSEDFVGSVFVATHQPAVTRHIGI